jgi:hypothetical protein
MGAIKVVATEFTETTEKYEKNILQSLRNNSKFV